MKNFFHTKKFEEAKVIAKPFNSKFIVLVKTRLKKSEVTGIVKIKKSTLQQDGFKLLKTQNY